MSAVLQPALTPFDMVWANYRFPPHIEPRPLQIEAINELALLQTSGLWLDMGTGKTFVSTVVALYYRLVHGNMTTVIVPPLLLPQWVKWLRSISPELTVVGLRGTVRQRKAMDVENADFVVVGIQIFKNDYDRFLCGLHSKEVTVIADEATFLSNPQSDNHRKFHKFAVGRHTMLLTGTPANKPGDAYGLIKFTSPGTYRNQRHFENLHVEERDFFEAPTKWMNLDLLNTNLARNAKRILYEDMFSDVEAPQFEPLEYDLEADHYKLYCQLCDEQLLALPDGGKIDATTANKLTHALGQIIVNPDYFSGDPDAPSNAVAMVEEKLEQLGSGKLVVFANYRMTVRKLVGALGRFGARAINSEVSESGKEKAVEAFIEDPSCRVLVVQFVSGGKGLDGLQHVCNHALFIEPCQQPRDFHQAVARLKRAGQRKRVWVGMAIANKTLQVRGFNSLLANDTLINQVIRNAVELRRAIYGE